MGFFNPNVVGSGASSINQAMSYLNQAKDKINTCNNYLDYRVRNRLYYNLGNLSGEISGFRDSASSIKSQVDNVINDYNRTLSKTNAMAGSTKSALSSDNIDNFKQMLSSDAQGLVNNLGFGFSTVIDLGNMALNDLNNKTNAVGAAYMDAANQAYSAGKGLYEMGAEFVKDPMAYVKSNIDGLAQNISDLSDSAQNAWNEMCASAIKAWEDTSAAVVSGATSLWESAQNLWDDFANSEAGKIIIGVATGVFDFVTTAISSIAMGISGLLNGILNVAEDIVDFVAIAGTAILTVPAAIIDVGSYLFTGEGAGMIDNLWAGTMGFVQTEHVNNAFEWIYTQTEVGKAVNEHAVDWMQYGSAGYEVSKGAGYLVGMIGLTVATGGVGGAAGGAAGLAGTAGRAGIGAIAKTGGKEAAKNGAKIAFASGTGSGTADAWRSGAGAFEGVGYGIANGAWEGSQWLVGGKFAGFGLKTVGIDVATGAADVPLRSALQGIYSDKSFMDRFNDNGGLSGIVMNMGLAGGFSGIGETSFFKKFFGNENKSQASKSSSKKVEKEVKLDTESSFAGVSNQRELYKKQGKIPAELLPIKSAIDEYVYLSNIKASESYNQWKTAGAYFQPKFLEHDTFINLESRMMELEKALDIKPSSTNHINETETIKSSNKPIKDLSTSERIDEYFELLNKKDNGKLTIESEKRLADLSMTLGILTKEPHVSGDKDFFAKTFKDDVETITERMSDFEFSDKPAEHYPDDDITLTDEMFITDQLDINEEMRFFNFDAFTSYYGKETANWRDSLNFEQYRIIKNYIGEDDFSSYVTMNGYLRGTLIDQFGNIQLYRKGSVIKYTPAQWYNKYNETVPQLLKRMEKEVATLNSTLNVSFKEPTVLYRGVSSNWLQNFLPSNVNVDDFLYKNNLSLSDYLKAFVGQTYSEKSFVSVAPTDEIWFVSSSKIKLEFVVDESSNFGPIGLYNQGEQEILLAQGQSFKIVDVIEPQQSDGQIVVRLEKV